MLDNMNSQNNLGYVIHHLGSAMDRQTDILLQDKFKIGFSQFKILLALREQNAVKQQKIANFLGQTEASISRQIKLLVNMGLVSSRKNPENKRQAVTSLTPRGAHVIAQAVTVLETHYAPMFSQLSPAQLEAFSRVIDNLHQRVCSTGLPGTCNI